MKTPIAVVLSCCVSIVASIPATAQNVRQSQAIASSDVLSQISMFSYREGPKSDLVFRGTPIAANASGKASVEFEDGNADISASVDDLPEPGSLGPYTTYILWALTPDGRAANQGVIGGYEGGKGEVKTSYGAPQFALIITAEPHFAVSLPSTMIALFNVADDVEGTESKVTTLTERADYSSLARIAIDEERSPAEIVQARYAVQIAEAAGAKQFAADRYAAASDKLGAAEVAAGARRNADRKAASDLAREAVIAGEDARRAAMVGAREAEVAANAEAQRAAAATAAAAAAASAAAAATEAERARSAAQNAERLRTEIRTRLDAALPTRVSERGLVSEIGGVHFATGTADLSSAAREALARFSGVVSSYPDLRFMVEGHTDNVGSAETNQQLSLRRAITVRDYLIAQGVRASAIDVAGFGAARPADDNATAEGRARNRRVEIVVSGGPLEPGGAPAR
jgi:outer membrane protein OmpA-like peptidoglycan-associated protein